jgi:hypothetical protein
MRRSISAVMLLVFFLAATSVVAKPRDTSDPRDPRDRSWFQQLFRPIVKVFQPTTTGDMLSPPKP